MTTVGLTGSRLGADITWTPGESVPADADIRLVVVVADGHGLRSSISLGSVRAGRHPLDAAAPAVPRGADWSRWRW